MVALKYLFDIKPSLSTYSLAELMKPALREERFCLSEKTVCCFLTEFLKAMTALTAILGHSNIPELFVHCKIWENTFQKW